VKRNRVVLIGTVSLALVVGGPSVVSGLSGIHAANAPATVPAAAGNTPANVILLVGDGMGVQEITAARYYQGVQNPLNVDRLPYTGFDTTYSVKKGAGPTYLPDYTPDSASAGTMIATGHKTNDGRISQGPSSSSTVPGQNYSSLVDSAQAQGKRVGVVTTVPLTDATPATMLASMSKRQCEGPADMTDCPAETKAAGGLGSIAEQAVDQRADVLLGGGRSSLQQTISGGPTAGKTPLQTAQEAGYRYVTTSSALKALTGADPVLGLFSSGSLPFEWSGPAATTGAGNAAVKCTEGQRPSSVPSLGEMTSKSLELLHGSAGFFLMVEGGAIDDAVHAANACGAIGETVAFDTAVGVAMDYQAQHPDTLVVVTADHSHAMQIINDDWSGSSYPTGYSANLTTKDNSPLKLTFGTAGFGGDGQPPLATPPSQQHTGGTVPVWAAGPGASSVMGTNDHTELFTLLGGTAAPVTPPTVAPSVTLGTVTNSSVALSWTAVPTATSYEITRDGNPAGTATGTSFTDSGRSPSTTYRYQVTASNSAGAGPASTEVTARTLAGTITAYSVSGDTWRYNDSGADLGTAWRAAGYDESSWKSGPTQAGYGDGDERTVLTWGSNPNAKPITSYARRTFDAGATIGDVKNLALRLLIDDAAVVYLNGTEIQRFNLPTGTITSTTRATTYIVGDGESLWRTYTLPVGALRAGVNQLAVEIHQDAPSSSDTSFDLELRPVR
jgi:alkaline phosphatase